MAPNLLQISVTTDPSINTLPFTITDDSEDLCTCDMTDTVLNVTCEGDVDCTRLDKQPGATIISPLVLSITGITGESLQLCYH